MAFEKKTSLRSTFSVNGEISNSDTRFMNITIDIMHTGLNLNNSYFEKEVVDSCIDSIKNTPVLGFIKYDKLTEEEDFAGHEYVMIRTENGIDEKYIGAAFGLIPESCNPRWITKECSDGEEREFLQVDALLWEKFSSATGILMRDSEKAQSMELSVSSIEGYEDDDGVFHFQRFMFDGACLLGDGVLPAMVDANVKINDVNFSMDEFSKTVQDELNNNFAIFSKLIEEEISKGGVVDMPEVEEVIEEIEQPEEELEVVEEVIEETPEATDEPEEQDEPEADFSLTSNQLRDELRAVVRSYEMMTDEYGYTYPRYWLADIQEDEVILEDEKDWNFYGAKFSMNGDAPVVDFESLTRKKIVYADFESGSDIQEGMFTFGEHIEEVKKAMNDRASDAEAKFAKLQEEFDAIKPKYDEYVAVEEQRKAEEINAQKDAKFAEYEDVLAENADFEALKEKKDEMSVDEIEKECAVLYVRASRPAAKFSKQTSPSAIVGVIDDTDDGESDGYINHAKYGRIRKQR